MRYTIIVLILALLISSTGFAAANHPISEKVAIKLALAYASKQFPKYEYSDNSVEIKVSKGLDGAWSVHLSAHKKPYGTLGDVDIDVDSEGNCSYLIFTRY